MSFLNFKPCALLKVIYVPTLVPSIHLAHAFQVSALEVCQWSASRCWEMWRICCNCRRMAKRMKVPSGITDSRMELGWLWRRDGRMVRRHHAQTPCSSICCWCWYGSVLKCCFAQGCALLNLNCQCIHIISEEHWNEASIICLFACGIVDSSWFSNNCFWSRSHAFKTRAILQLRFSKTSTFWRLKSSCFFCSDTQPCVLSYRTMI